jgi:hypothetical protein
VEPLRDLGCQRSPWLGDDLCGGPNEAMFVGGAKAEGGDPFDDFEEDDFDDDFDDDFEEDWEDDLTEDEEFPDTFGGEDDPDEVLEPGDDEEEESPFSDDPDFDDA